LAIEYLCAAQALEFHKDLRPGDGAQAARALLRTRVPPLEDDRYVHADMVAAHELIHSGELVAAVDAAVDHPLES
jgi:histidine ammonia-lyase